jgi:hypothetical protein
VATAFLTAMALLLGFAGLCAAEPVRHQPAPDAAITGRGGPPPKGW